MQEGSSYLAQRRQHINGHAARLSFSPAREIEAGIAVLQNGRFYYLCRRWVGNPWCSSTNQKEMTREDDVAGIGIAAGRPAIAPSHGRNAPLPFYFSEEQEGDNWQLGGQDARYLSTRMPGVCGMYIRTLGPP